MDTYMTYIEWRNRPIMFHSVIKNVLRSNRGFNGIVHIWKLREATKDYIYVGEIDLRTVPPNEYLDSFIEDFLNKD